MEKQGPLSGQQVKEKYQLGRLLDRGGMGTVYKAQDVHLKRLVAVKVMSPANPVSAAELQDYMQRFQEEALRLANLKHRGIPHIYEYFEEAGRWFLVMEFIEGETLTSYLQRRGGQLQVSEVLTIGSQLADVLQYLHQLPTPLIFRDLKPDNVMIAPDGQIFLIDFGIARLFIPGKSQDTFVALSQGYAAPEQHGSAQTTVRSDIYSLGATLHHLLSGTHPATSPFLFAPLSLQQSPQLATLIAHMVAIDAAHRTASMAEVKEALQRMIDQTAVTGLSTSTVPLPPTPIPPASLTATQPAQPRMRAAPLVGAQLLPTASSSRGTTLVIRQPRFEAKAAALAWSPDGQRIASINAYTQIEIWDAITGKTLVKQEGEVDVFLVAIVWSPDGKYVVTCVGHNTTIWEVTEKLWRRKPERGGLFSEVQKEPDMIL